MLFKLKIPNILKRKHKNRVKRNISFYSLNFRYFSVVSLNSYRLYMSRLRVLNLFLAKSVKRFRRISKKDRFRKITNDYVIQKHFINKQAIYRLGASALFEGFKKTREIRRIIAKTNLNWKKVPRISRNFICFDLPKIPYTRKPIGARMGKGKGTIKAWFVRIYPGCRIIYLKNWKTKPAIYILNLILLFLPGHNYLIKPWFFKGGVFLNNLSNFY